MSHRTRFGATRDFKRHTLKKKIRRGGRAASQFRRDAWPGLLREVNEKAHNHLGSRMGRFARIFGQFASLFLVSLPQTSLSQERHVKRRACRTETEFGPCARFGASLCHCVGCRRSSCPSHGQALPKNASAAAWAGYLGRGSTSARAWHGSEA